jgi:hypothetical protein
VLCFCCICLRPVSCVPNVASVSRLCFLDCPFVFSNVYLSCVLCLVYPMLSESLDSPSVITLWFSLTFICPVSCVPNVASVSRLCFLDCPFVFSNVYLSCVLCLVYPMLSVSLDSPSVITLWFSLTFICPVCCVSNVASVSRFSILDYPFGFL